MLYIFGKLFSRGFFLATWNINFGGSYSLWFSRTLMGKKCILYLRVCLKCITLLGSLHYITMLQRIACTQDSVHCTALFWDSSKGKSCIKRHKLFHNLLLHKTIIFIQSHIMSLCVFSLQFDKKGACQVKYIFKLSCIFRGAQWQQKYKTIDSPFTPNQASIFFLAAPGRVSLKCSASQCLIKKYSTFSTQMNIFAYHNLLSWSLWDRLK